MNIDTPSSRPQASLRGVAVVANPASGSSSDEEQLRDAFAQAGVEATWMPTTPDDPGIGQAAQAVADGIETIVACGGDGTVRAVLQSVAGTATVLGVVPLGTGNLLAGNLELPAGLDAVHTAVHGIPIHMDVGVVNEERFVVMAGVGFDALMIRDASPGLKKRLGTVAYVLSGARNLHSRLFHAVVSCDGKEIFRGRTAMVLVGNCGTVSGGLKAFPDAQPDDGMLDIAVLAARGVRQWSSVGWRLLRGRAQRDDLVHRSQASEVAVVLSRPVAYELDGEVRDAASELRFTIEPSALTVRAPIPASP